MFAELDDTTYEKRVLETRNGIVIFYKKLCPFCKSMEKCMEKVSTLDPGICVFRIDSEANPNAMQALGIERVPTLVSIKNGKVTATKAGLMNPMQVRAWQKRD
jgi:thioredoxin 1